MLDSFDDYKSIIDNNVINFDYLYSGDVISSMKSSYSEIKDINSTSPRFIISAIDDIYLKSIEYMKSISDELIIVSSGDKSINSYIKMIDYDIIKNYKYAFTSKVKDGNVNNVFPSYFYKITHLYQIEFYKLLDDGKDVIIYLCDKPIQSLVYSLHNMKYEILPLNGGYHHKMVYDFYECDFNSLKVHFKDISSIRNEKLEVLLDE
jgi:hypothetical protein